MKRHTFKAIICPSAVIALAVVSTCAPLGAEDVIVRSLQAISAEDGLLAEWELHRMVTLDFGPTREHLVIPTQTVDGRDVILWLSDIDRLEFSSTVSGVGEISGGSNEGGWHLTTNPVYDSLCITRSGSWPDGVCSLMVCDMMGHTVAGMPDWKGEPVDMRHLAPGQYIVSINRTSLKFFKK